MTAGEDGDHAGFVVGVEREVCIRFGVDFEGEAAVVVELDEEGVGPWEVFWVVEDQGEAEKVVEFAAGFEADAAVPEGDELLHLRREGGCRLGEGLGFLYGG